MTEEKLEILVVEDKIANQESARWTLRDHNVDIAEDFAQAIKKLVGVKEGDKTPRDLTGKTSKYNVVLSDLMFPLGGGRGMMCKEIYEEQPLGFPLALIASRLQVPEVAILTDMNHHTGPIAETFDFMYDRVDYTRPIFRIGNTRFMMFDERDFRSAYLLRNGKVSEEDSLLRPCEIQFPEDLETDYERKEITGDERYPEGYGLARRKETYKPNTGKFSDASVKNWAQALSILRNGYREKKK